MGVVSCRQVTLIAVVVVNGGEQRVGGVACRVIFHTFGSVQFPATVLVHLQRSSA